MKLKERDESFANFLASSANDYCIWRGEEMGILGSPHTTFNAVRAIDTSPKCNNTGRTFPHKKYCYPLSFPHDWFTFSLTVTRSTDDPDLGPVAGLGHQVVGALADEFVVHAAKFSEY